MREVPQRLASPSEETPKKKKKKKSDKYINHFIQLKSWKIVISGEELNRHRQWL